uniref:Putative secreted protein n=1 Tax=Anopheles darlingi TaxID=43151 RepID=A0A2M4DEP0_ANODA
MVHFPIQHILFFFLLMLLYKQNTAFSGTVCVRFHFKFRSRGMTLFERRISLGFFLHILESFHSNKNGSSSVVNHHWQTKGENRKHQPST